MQPPTSSPSRPKSPHHERTKSSPSSLQEFDLSPLKGESPGWGRHEGRVSPRYETPPGTPPPPYYGASKVNKALKLFKVNWHFNYLIVIANKCTLSIRVLEPKPEANFALFCNI